MPEAVQQRRGLVVHAGPVQHAKAPGLAAEADVLGDGTLPDEADFLVDRADAARLRRLRAGRGEVRAPEPHLPGIARGVARQHLDQRALARAVLADQRMHLACADRERSAAQGGHAAIRLVDAVHLQQRRSHGLALCLAQ